MKAHLIAMTLLLVASTALGSPPDERAEVIVTVGERVITRAVLDDAVSVALGSFFHRELAEEKRLELEREQVQVLIERELNIIGGLERGLERPKSEAQDARVAIEERLGKAKYESSLGAASMSRSDHRRAIADYLLAEKAYREFVIEAATASDSELRAEWSRDPERWQAPEMLHVLHILKQVDPAAAAPQVEAARAAAETARQRVLDGENFADVAATVSDDMYAIKGGDLGWVHEGRIVTELEDALWKAEIETIIGPVRSHEGFHLAMIVARRAPRPMEYAEVEPLLRKMLETRRLEQARTAWFDELRTRHQVTIHRPELRPRDD